MHFRLLMLSSLVCLALVAAACGGSGAETDARALNDYSLSLNVVEGGAASYALNVTQGDTLLVDVRVEDAADLTRSFVELNYDADLISPLRVVDGGFLGSDTLMLDVTHLTGTVPVAIARTGLNPDGVSGAGVIARVEFALKPQAERSTYSHAGNAVITGIDLDQDANTITVHWADDNAGDTNSDQYLNGLDLFPIAARFDKSTGDPEYSSCADANGDGTINGQDVFPLALRYDQRFDAHNVYWDVRATMDEAFTPDNTVPIPVDYAGSCGGDYMYTIGPLPDDAVYYVGVTTLDDTAGEESDFTVSESQVLGDPDFFLPAVNLTGEDLGDYVALDWDKPDTPERVRGYHVFRKPQTGGSYEDISGKISGTSFDDMEIGDLDSGNFLYHVVVEYDNEVMSDPTSDIVVFWERVNLEPWIDAVTTTLITLDSTNDKATLTVDGDDGEGGDDITWTWTVLSGSGSFPGGDTGESVTFDSSASSAEKITIQVTGDDGAFQVTETIRLVFTTYSRVPIGTTDPNNGRFVDFTLDLIDGGTVNFANDVFDNGHVVFMNFWASWCGPCKAEMPDIQDLYDTYHSQGYDMLYIGVHWNGYNGETMAKEVSYRNSQGYTATWWAYDNGASPCYDMHEIPSGGIPESYIFDRDGYARYRKLGGINEATVEAVIQDLI